VASKHIEGEPQTMTNLWMRAYCVSYLSGSLRSKTIALQETTYG